MTRMALPARFSAMFPNLTLYADAAASVLLYSSNPEDTVFNIRQVQECNVQEHFPWAILLRRRKYAVPVWVYLRNNTNTRFTGCDVYGCGTLGFNIVSSDKIVVDKTKHS